jgi:hypothetical protein
VQTYEPGAGCHISRAAAEMCLRAKADNDSVIATFNEIQLLAHPETEPDEVVREYDEASARRSAAYRSSPEGRAAVAAQEERERRNRARAGEVKAFPLHAVLTLATGRVWGDFSRAHEAAEWLFGRGIQTIEFAFNTTIKDRALAALPAVSDLPEADYPTSPEDVDARLAAQVARFGDAIRLSRGDGQS